jgi:TolA-binding protein
MVRTLAPSLAWLLPVPTTSTEGQESAAATSAELVQQIKPLTLDLPIVRHSLEQLATKIEQLGVKQEQMAQSIATLQAVEQDISQRLSSPTQSRAVPPRKSSQPTAQSARSSVSPPPPTGQPLR